jgi:hypothetical protein
VRRPPPGQAGWQQRTCSKGSWCVSSIVKGSAGVGDSRTHPRSAIVPTPRHPGSRVFLVLSLIRRVEQRRRKRGWPALRAGGADVCGALPFCPCQHKASTCLQTPPGQALQARSAEAPRGPSPVIPWPSPTPSVAPATSLLT